MSEFDQQLYLNNAQTFGAAGLNAALPPQQAQSYAQYSYYQPENNPTSQIQSPLNANQASKKYRHRIAKELFTSGGQRRNRISDHIKHGSYTKHAHGNHQPQLVNSRQGLNKINTTSHHDPMQSYVGGVGTNHNQVTGTGHRTARNNLNQQPGSGSNHNRQNLTITNIGELNPLFSTSNNNNANGVSIGSRQAMIQAVAGGNSLTQRQIVSQYGQKQQKHEMMSQRVSQDAQRRGELVNNAVVGNLLNVPGNMVMMTQQNASQEDPMNQEMPEILPEIQNNGNNGVKTATNISRRQMANYQSQPE